MEELYAEDFASPLTKRVANEDFKNEEIEEEKDHTLYGHFLNLEKAIVGGYSRMPIVSPFLKDIRRAVEKEEYEQLLGLTDTLEELLDLDFST